MDRYKHTPGGKVRLENHKALLEALPFCNDFVWEFGIKPKRKALE